MVVVMVDVDVGYFDCEFVVFVFVLMIIHQIIMSITFLYLVLFILFVATCAIAMMDVALNGTDVQCLVTIACSVILVIPDFVWVVSLSTLTYAPAWSPLSAALNDLDVNHRTTADGVRE